MEAIRTKDKIFLVTVVPLVLAAVYVYCWRNGAVQSVEVLRKESAALVRVEDFDIEKQSAERRLKAAEDELAAEKKIPIPPARVKADAADGVAARELAVLEVFRAAGLVVDASRAVEAGSSANGDALRKTGTRPTPVLRAYELTGGYASIVSAFGVFAEREMAVVPEAVEMVEPKIWKVVLWL